MSEFIPPATQFVDLPHKFVMKRGAVLSGARIAYETWGGASADGDNVILILTGLSPNAHAASHSGDYSLGWWESMVGPGKPIDTNRWHVVCLNSLGSCYGSTGPASRNPATGESYKLDFPELCIEDIADAAAFAVRRMGFERLACVIGCSMGAMTALSFLSRHPTMARSHINISGTVHALPFTIAIRSLQREAIRLDPNWKSGSYSADAYPEIGMSIARKLGVITYRSALEWDGRFGRVRLDPDCSFDVEPFGLEFEVEGYLEAHARRFIRGYDPNSYLYLSRAIDWFDLGENCGGNALGVLSGIRAQKGLVIGVHSDILFPVQQQLEIAEGMRAGGMDVTFLALDSPQGHDAFLVDFDQFGPAVSDFLLSQGTSDLSSKSSVVCNSPQAWKKSSGHSQTSTENAL